MPQYRVTNRITGEMDEIEAPFAQAACEMLNWLIGNCHVELLREGPFTLSGWAMRRLHIAPENESRLARLRGLGRR